MRPRRPSKDQLAAAIREEGGNLSRVAARLGTTRQTLYTWVYQLDLSKLAGVVTEEDRERRAALEVADAVTQASLRLRASLWRWVRIHAIEQGSTAAGVVERALREYQERAEAQKGASGSGRTQQRAGSRSG